ncbi:uncharacterized protein LOC143427507 [Xylocopa sonorina]|uniref:uncharacterized protein LOC143427507 n=1 Tax=Xylocopa sonorina TaxID=1818115 RepID=UPI00403ABD2C
MAKHLYFLAFTALVVHAQENAIRNLSPSLRECYENKYLLEKDNKLPDTLDTFIAILRKIENTEGLNMDLRSLSVALLHRFRQDGIAPDPHVAIQDGITPYAPNTFEFFRHSHTLHLIPGNAITFPNNSITDIERCTLHVMLSGSIEIFERGDESKVCKSQNLYRHRRDIKSKSDKNSKNTVNDVETFSPDEIESMPQNKSKGRHVTDDPNSFYPALPPNHPDSAQIRESTPTSKCPVENGVVKTPWGTTSLGLVLAGIAAATQPEITPLYHLQPKILQENKADMKEMSVDNKWFATLAGDLAEVALIQGPMGRPLKVGLEGFWNSTALPKWYFLNSNDNIEMTTAEIRGDLDGLILANEVNKWYSKIPSLRLSQIFDMYYSRLGLFDSSIRACNRRTLFTSVAPNETMVNQTYSAALLLSADLAQATLEKSIIKKFSVQAVNELAKYVPSSMNNDLSCAETDKLYDNNQISVDLTIILDTNWDFRVIKPILANLLRRIDLNQFNSNFTLLNGADGSPMINSTFDILEFYSYNSSHYANITHGFDLSKALNELQVYLTHKLNNERNRGIGGARSDVVLIVPYNSDTSKNNNNFKEYCLQTVSQMQEQFPDTTLLIMAYRSKDTWSDLVQNRITDLFSIGAEDSENTSNSINNIVSRIKKVPKRLINSQCGANYIPSGSSNSFDDYVIPNGVNFYKLHPNYFFNHEKTATIKIQSFSSDNLTVCSSRDPLNTNTTGTTKLCSSISNNVHTITVSCGDTAFVHKCSPLYISVTSNSLNSSSYQCTDGRVCRYPTSIKYTISYESLTCVSSATKITFNFIILIIALVFYNL